MRAIATHIANGIMRDKNKHMTSIQFLQSERQRTKEQGKFEFLNGKLQKMLGTTNIHNIITGNLFALLWNALREKNYIVYPSDMRVHNPLKNSFCYADIAVVKGVPKLLDQSGDTVLNPVLIVEVLSEKTALYDRTKKFKAYRSIPTLQEYILVDQNPYCVEGFYKNENGNWVVHNDSSNLNDSFMFKSISCKINLKNVYAKTGFNK